MENYEMAKAYHELVTELLKARLLSVKEGKLMKDEIIAFNNLTEFHDKVVDERK